MEAVMKDLRDAFAEFRQKNNQRLDSVEDKVKDFDKAYVRMQRLGLGGGGGIAQDPEKMKGFRAFLRSGDPSVFRAALSTGSDPDGGYAVPEEIDKLISSVAQNVNPLRKLATVIVAGTPDYKKLFTTSRAAAEWVDEDDARNATATPSLASLTPYWGELHASPVASQWVLDDAFFSIESWLAEEVGKAFGESEGVAFIAGTGTKQPRGITAYATAATADDVRAFGTLQYVISGAAADFATASATVSPADAIVNLIYATKASYRQNASFLTNRKTLGSIMKFKDTEGRPVWTPALTPGQPSTLLGYPVFECEDVPDVGAGTYPIIFGDFKAGYTVAERPFGTRILRDPYTQKPNTVFYTTRRIGGMVVDSNALKLLKIAAA